EISQTILKRWISKVQYQWISNLPNLQQRVGRNNPLISLHQSKNISTSHTIQLHDDIFQQWKLLVSRDLRDVVNLFECKKSIIFEKKRYCNVKSHVEDSIIEYSINNAKSLGHIDNIVTLVGGDPDIWWLIIKPFKKLENNEIEKDPFHPFPDLNCSILLDQTEDAIIINSQSVLGHAASLKNPPGSFGIDQATLCLVSLHSSQWIGD
ncbi:hypothetical protein O181_103760, partial [Austropuccinia psidii MF-1]|nr:hypothetical protein [Austropuccinia psidii MF-1]